VLGHLRTDINDTALMSMQHGSNMPQLPGFHLQVTAKRSIALNLVQECILPRMLMSPQVRLLSYGYVCVCVCVLFAEATFI
jgi:hypothetical protein